MQVIDKLPRTFVTLDTTLSAFLIDLGFLSVLSKSNKHEPDLRMGAGLELRGKFDEEQNVVFVLVDNANVGDLDVRGGDATATVFIFSLLGLLLLLLDVKSPVIEVVVVVVLAFDGVIKKELVLVVIAWVL